MSGGPFGGRRPLHPLTGDDRPFDGLSDVAPEIARLGRNTVRMAWVVVLTFVLFVVGLIAGLLYVAAQVIK